MNRRTLTMDFDSLEADDDDSFFESNDRLSTVVPLDLVVDDANEDDDFEDSRMSFAVSAMNSPSIKRIYSIEKIPSIRHTQIVAPSYDMWMAEPGDLKERRQRLFTDMGLGSNRNFLKLTSTKVVRANSRRPEPEHKPESKPESTKDGDNNDPSPDPGEESRPEGDSSESRPEGDSSESEPSPDTAVMLVRSRSDGDIDCFSAKTKQRKEEMIGKVSKQRLTKTSSWQLMPTMGFCQYSSIVKVSPASKKEKNKPSMANSNDVSLITDNSLGSFFLIKNLDTGNDFIVKEYNEEGMWGKLNDLQTGKQLTMEEFEKSVGYSPVVKELMRRASRNENSKNNYFSKSFRNSKRKSAAFFRNLSTSMSGLMGEAKLEGSSPPEAAQKDTKDTKKAKDSKTNNNSNDSNNSNSNSSQWVEAHQTGKSYKEFTALHLSQEIQAHEGAIWTIRFSSDGHYLASAGEDKTIHVWEVQECDVQPTGGADDLSNTTSSFRSPLAEITFIPSEMKKKGKANGKKGNSIPDYVNVPETVLALSDKPVCTFEGHTDEILDLAWSKSRILLSSSMDKTVKMWDVETKTCLKTFVHSDFVTCIQFNPVDDDRFISGSLDKKIRIWNVPDRKVVDWMDVCEMVTAACYTPDGQGAIVGSQEGSCRMYSIDDGKLEHTMDIQKKKKPPAKMFPAFPQSKKPPTPQSGKITGFEFTPWNPSEVLITSADSRIGIYSGSDAVQKFKGYRNTSSQISASFTPDGKYVICASEDSQVYIWRVYEPKNPGESKRRSTVTVQAHEHFLCRDVTAAIPWPGSIKNEPPLVELNSKGGGSKSSKRTTTPPQASNSSSRSTSPGPEDNSFVCGDSVRGGALPPMPKKKNQSPNLETNDSGGEEELDQSSGNIDPGIGVTESFRASSESMRYGDSPSISVSNAVSPSQRSMLDSGSGGNANTIQATAWGLAIVTASLDGEIRVYQNFGLPIKVNRPLF